jgi:hypothetical protein
MDNNETYEEWFARQKAEYEAWLARENAEYDAIMRGEELPDDSEEIAKRLRSTETVGDRFFR